MAWTLPRLALTGPFLVLGAPACAEDGGSAEAETTAGSTGASTGSGTTSPPGTDSGSTTTAATATTTTTGTTVAMSTGPTVCETYAEGTWGDCATPMPMQPGDVSVCNYTGSGTTFCYVESWMRGINWSVCTLRDCTTDCDCFAAPEGSTAVPRCRQAALQMGGSVCVLGCSTDGECPAGMICRAGSCVWDFDPNVGTDTDTGATT